MKSKTFNAIVIIGFAVAFTSYAIFKHGVGSFFHQLSGLNYGWVLLGFMGMVGFWVFETFLLHIFLRQLYPGQKLLVSLKAAMVGQFFGAITPLTSGGQPAQLYVLVENGLEAGSASSSLMMKFSVHQVVLTCYSLIIIILKFGYFNSRLATSGLSHLFYFVFVGFLVNSAIIVFTALISVNEKLTKTIISFIFKILSKLRLIKDIEKSEKGIEEQLYNFHNNAAAIWKNKKFLAKTFVFTAMQLTSFFSIPYCIYRAFHLSSQGFINLLAAQIFVFMIQSFIPLPGASGGSEGAFLLIFGLFFPEYSITPALILWRVITYYSCIGVGSIFTLIMPQGKKKDMAANTKEIGSEERERDTKKLEMERQLKKSERKKQTSAS